MTAARPAVERPALPPRINASARGVLVPRLIRWSFYMYVASLPLERLSSSVPIEVATLTGAVLIASAARSPLACFGRIPSAATGLVAVLCMLTIGYLEHGRSSGEVMIYLILFVELILLLWVGFNLMYDDRIALRGLLALILACTIVAISQLATGIHIDPRAPEEEVGALAFNKNARARVLTAGTLASVGLAIGTGSAGPVLRGLGWPAAGLLGFATVQTGSRGASLALAAGLVILMFAGSARTMRPTYVYVAAVALGVTFWLALQSQPIRSGFTRAFEAGEMSGRERIYPMAFEMFLEKPLTGWGAIYNHQVLAERLMERRYTSRDTHNTYLEVITATGILGAVPFVTTIALCVLAAWRARGGTYGTLPLAILLSALVASLSRNDLTQKHLWFALTFALASGARASARNAVPVVWNRSEGRSMPDGSRVRMAHRASGNRRRTISS